MSAELDTLLTRCGGAISREDALQVVSRHTLDNEVKAGRLVAVFPRAYCRPWDVDDERTRWRAALRSVAGDVGLSHTSALRAWNLPAQDPEPIHVKAYQPRHPRGRAGELIVHRTLLPLEATEADGMPTVALESALIDSWPLLSGTSQRAPMLEAMRRRLVRPARLAAAAEKMFWVTGVAQARALVGLVSAGCESELELWGYQEVFDVPELADVARQRWIEVGQLRFRLDMAFEAELLNVELDGRKYHDGPKKWERDIRRDRLIAKLGWQTLRFSHDQLHDDPVGCCREVIAIRRLRRRMLRIA